MYKEKISLSTWNSQRLFIDLQMETQFLMLFVVKWNENVKKNMKKKTHRINCAK